MTTFLAFYQNLGPALTLLVLVTFLLAGTVKGVIGLGLPTVAMGLLGLAMLPPQAAALLLVPSTVTNLWQLAFGGALCLYALSGLLLPPLRVPTAYEPWLGPLCGLLTGLVTAATGVFVIPAVPYLQALGLQRNELVQA